MVYCGKGGDFVPTARTRANRKYNERVYDQLKIQVRKGVRDSWKVAASARGLSLAALIVSAVEEYLSAHPAESSGAPAPSGDSPDNSPADR